MKDEPVVAELEVSEVDGDTLAAPHGAGEREEDQRTVASAGEALREGSHHLSDVVDERRALALGSFTLLP